MNARLRKVTLTLHVAVSVGWLGAVLAYLPFAIRSVSGVDPETARTIYGAMDTIGWGVIVPCAFGALVTGLIQSLGTSWGLFRHYWVLAKFVLTVGGITILLMHMPLVSRLTQAVQEGGIMTAGIGKPLLVHATGGLVILGLAVILSVFKPWGLTAYGRGKLNSGNFSPAIGVGGEMLSAKRSINPKIWVAIAILLGIGAVVGFAVLHHLRGGMPSH